VAKRDLAKLCLNSFWGKLMESNYRPKSKMIAEPEELFRFPATPGIKVSNLKIGRDEVVRVTWKYAGAENMPALRHINEVVRAYVTTGARLKLPLSRRAGRESHILQHYSVIYV
jgi:hypothetical protein